MCLCDSSGFAWELNRNFVLDSVCFSPSTHIMRGKHARSNFLNLHLSVCENVQWLSLRKPCLHQKNPI